MYRLKLAQNSIFYLQISNDCLVSEGSDPCMAWFFEKFSNTWRMWGSTNWYNLQLQKSFLKSQMIMFPEVSIIFFKMEVLEVFSALQ